MKAPQGDFRDWDAIDAWADELLDVQVPYNHPELFFQHPDGRRWIGYRAGTYLVDCAMRASGQTAAELAVTPTDEILALASRGRT